MNPQKVHDQFGEYRGHLFLVEARQENEVWVGRYRLMGSSADQAADAAALSRHKWTPLDPGWATINEAESNATEAAHAAIDALVG